MLQLDIIEALEQVTDCLEEAHQDEILNGHFGDSARDCSYCQVIAKARDILRQIAEEAS